MITVENVEKQLETRSSGIHDGTGLSAGYSGRSPKEKHTGTLFAIYPNERLEKKPELKNVGRNSKCICGSGKKFKKCCLSKMNFNNMYELKENKQHQKKY